MTYTYTLAEEDILLGFLFEASKSDRIKKQWARTRITYFISLLIFSFLAYTSKANFLAFYFLILAIFLFFRLSHYQKQASRNNYIKYIQESYKQSLDEPTTIIFSTDTIEIFNKFAESKIYYSAIEAIEEIKDYFFLKLKTADRLIIPKKSIHNIDDLKKELLSLVDKLNVRHNVELNWEWH